MNGPAAGPGGEARGRREEVATPAPDATPADRPARPPRPGWRILLRELRVAARDDDLTLLAAGVAFFALLSLVPALVALVSVYGLFADPAGVEGTVEELAGALPEEARALVTQQLRAIVAASPAGLGVAALAGAALALWSASSAVQHLLRAVGAVSSGARRGYARARLLALGLASGAIVSAAASVALIALLPAVLRAAGVGAPGRALLGLARWPLLAAAMLAALSVVYRLGAGTGPAPSRRIGPGALLATSGWLVASMAFSAFASRSGRYNETYGSLGAVAVLMLWLFGTAWLVLLGAELDTVIRRAAARGEDAGGPRAGRRGRRW